MSDFPLSDGAPDISGTPQPIEAVDIPLDTPPAPEPERINLIDPVIGDAVSVAPSDVDRMLARGFRRETPEEAIAVGIETAKEDYYGGRHIEGALFGALQGIAPGAGTLAASAIGLEPEYIEEVKKRSPAFIAAEIMGGVTSSLAAPGKGLLGTVARATPTGALTQATARLTAPIAASGTLGTIGAQTIRGALDAGVAAAANELARQAVREAPINTDAVLAQMGKAGVFGGALGGGLAAIGAGLAKVPARTQGVQSTSQKWTEILAKRKPVPLSEIFPTSATSRKGLAKAATRLRDEVSKRSKIAAPLVRELDDKLITAQAEALELAPGFTEQVEAARTAIIEQADAARAASDWLESSKITTIDFAPTPKKVQPELAEGIDAMRRLDAADKALESAIAPLGMQVPQSGALGIKETLMARAGTAIKNKLPSISARGIAQDALQQAIPGIGPVLGALTKFQALTNAASGLGVLPSGGLMARTASAVTHINNEIASITSNVARVIPRVQTPARPTLSKYYSASEQQEVEADIARLQGLSIPEINQAITEEYADADPELGRQVSDAMTMKIEYLKSIAPQPPPGFVDFGGYWQPSPTESRRFFAVQNALDEPVTAVAALLEGQQPYAQPVVDALQSVYPQIYGYVRTELQREASDIYENRDHAEAALLGQLWDITLAPSNLPDYQQPMPDTGQQTLQTPQPLGGATAQSEIAASMEVRPPKS